MKRQGSQCRDESSLPQHEDQKRKEQAISASHARLEKTPLGVPNQCDFDASTEAITTKTTMVIANSSSSRSYL